MNSVRALLRRVAGLVLVLLLLPGWSGEKPPPLPQKPESPPQAREAVGTERPAAPGSPAAPQPPGTPSGPPAQVLPPVKVESFGEIPPLVPAVVKPVMKDQATTVEKAANYQAVMNFLGLRLSPAQKEFLNRHKFLLVPKRAIKLAKGEEEFGPYDEMLGLFDRLGGPENPEERRPFHSRLVNPDVVLHAFHKYQIGRAHV